MKKRCYSCMCEIAENALYCTQCGFSYNNYMKTKNSKTLMPGTILHDRYEIGRDLGMGGFGVTYVGFDRNLDIKVAIKEFFPSSHASRNVTENSPGTSMVIADYDSAAYQDGLKQFLREARTIARFNKEPGIVSVTDYFEANKTGYYVMDFLPGDSLKTIIDQKQSPMSEQEVIRLLKPVILALRKIHEAGIVHRDISPDNMVFDDKQKLTLIDFGAAKSTDYVELGTSIQLKHGYAPLEQYSLDGEQGPWTDVYALCATIYYMISHAKPPKAPDRYQHDTIISLYDLGLTSRNFSDVVMQGLHVDYQHRFKNLDALVRAFYDRRPSPQPVPPPQPVPSPDAGSGTFGVFIAVILCSCCIVLAVLLFMLLFK